MLVWGSEVPIPALYYQLDVASLPESQGGSKAQPQSHLQPQNRNDPHVYMVCVGGFISLGPHKTTLLLL